MHIFQNNAHKLRPLLRPPITTLPVMGPKEASLWLSLRKLFNKQNSECSGTFLGPEMTMNGALAPDCLVRFVLLVLTVSDVCADSCGGRGTAQTKSRVIFNPV